MKVRAGLGAVRLSWASAGASPGFVQVSKARLNGTIEGSKESPSASRHEGTRSTRAQRWEEVKQLERAVSKAATSRRAGFTAHTSPSQQKSAGRGGRRRDVRRDMP
ncbi:hypothetical protein AV530_000611 [Patagioenas fasciata monilis]|uniref:Uncharacterized protein n=1 Tax=Patagioenas fasciata monilis TaxID=372326 RepID=A0A1V4IGA1_PATFA|nr:hypothetical protein AV530_000611 [Patagioenas fasciata monilis]